MYQRLFNAETIISLKLICFLSLFAAVSIMKGKRSAFIYFSYQTDSGVPNTSIYSAVSLASPYYNYLNLPHLRLWYPDVVTVIANTKHVKTWKRRNVVGIDMIRNNHIDFVFHVETWQARKTKRNLQFLTNLSKPEWCVDNSWKTSQFRFSLPFIQFIISYGDQT